MRLRLPALLLAALCTAASLQAQLVLTFEGLQDMESINDAYNGGTGSLGTSLTNYGVSFSSNGLALIAGAAGGSGNFQNAPSGDTILFFTNGASTVMNVADGFRNQFSVSYATPNFTGSVNIYDGLNATGNILGSVVLTSTPAGTPIPYDLGYSAGVSFSGTARSVDFAGTGNQIGFDNITLGAATAVPEPSTYGLFGAAALVGLAVWRRRSVRR